MPDRRRCVSCFFARRVRQRWFALRTSGGNDIPRRSDDLGANQSLSSHLSLRDKSDEQILSWFETN